MGHTGHMDDMPMKRLLFLLLLFTPVAANAQRHIWIEVPWQRTTPGMTFGGNTRCYGSSTSTYQYGTGVVSGSTNCVQQPTFSTPPTTNRYVLKVHVDCIDQTYDAKGDLAGWRSWRNDLVVYERAQEACRSRSTRSTSIAKDDPSYCTWNPWDGECQSKSQKKHKVSSGCLKALEKYDCKYTNYLEANPSMQNWVKSNPEMARKEALRLKAVDADEIGAKAKQVEISPPQAEKADAAETCLKAADYKGCMEYNKSN